MPQQSGGGPKAEARTEAELDEMAVEVADLIADNLDAEQLQRLVLLLPLEPNELPDGKKPAGAPQQRPN